jgi:hypothetical protein
MVANSNIYVIGIKYDIDVFDGQSKVGRLTLFTVHVDVDVHVLVPSPAHVHIHVLVSMGSDVHVSLCLLSKLSGLMF